MFSGFVDLRSVVHLVRPRPELQPAEKAGPRCLQRPRLLEVYSGLRVSLLAAVAADGDGVQCVQCFPTQISLLAQEIFENQTNLKHIISIVKVRSFEDYQANLRV